MTSIPTSFTEMMGIRYPIIAAPMFLVSNEEIVARVSNAGAIGTFPALNYRPIEEYKRALKKMRELTKKPIGVNVIVNQSNQRRHEDLKYALDSGVELFITSLGSPRDVIRDAHKNGAKVLCDVTNLEHALKVEDMGADGVIAVSSGAGGHAGPISPIVLVPWLKERLKIPIVAAGGITDGNHLAAMLALGASAVSVGTRFIASTEAGVTREYKDAIVGATPEDIVLTTKVSGIPANVINTPYIKKSGTRLNFVLDRLQKNRLTKKPTQLAIHVIGMRALEKAAAKPTWKTVWSAGQSAGLVHDVIPCEQIVERFVDGYFKCVRGLPAGDSK